jgi:hypothetical protein
VAVAGFRKYTISARKTEAHNMLGGIRAAQGAYFQGFGQYCGTPAEALHPAGMVFPTQQKVMWEPVPEGPWRDLGVRSPGQVWFQYRLRAGTANDGAGPAFLTQPTSHWYQASAHGQFDTQTAHFFEVTSATTTVFERTGPPE